ncbi:MAG: DUF4159 domain-containing protein [Pelagimonas sp.]|jgi:hypothetical protein|nr:DUF4159 domain-containing protein [Pelagimonas sp.]
MSVFGALGFTAPWLLLALIALPLLWILLRAVPPAPVRRVFPGVTLLLGLKDDDQISDRTPWWLLLLRMLAAAAVIIGLAGPVLNPEQRSAEGEGSAPVLVVLDGSWASARDWQARMLALDGLLTRAGREDRPVALLRLSDPQEPRFGTADVLRSRLSGLTPLPWAPMPDLPTLPKGDFDSWWFSDGLERDSRSALLTALEARGTVTIHESPRPLLALEPVTFADGLLNITAHRLRPGPAREVTLLGQGRDPAGNPATLLRTPIAFDSGATQATLALSLQDELRARITRFELAGANHAGAVALPDDSLRQREVALVSGLENREGLQLLSQLHFIEQALVPHADLLQGPLEDILPANPDVIVLADVATLSPSETDDISDWIERGGLLLRFAGPRLAASDVSRSTEDPLMPVRLRAGGRTLGGAMSWGAPKTLAPFDETSPFFGLPIPDEVQVRSQVVAQPDPVLAQRVIAQLSDGTPLVTRKRIGQGQVVLFHVTANAEWSSLPISGLFVQMLERLVLASDISASEETALQGTIWQPLQVLDGFGALSDGATLPGVAGEDLIAAPLGPRLVPGIYQGEDQILARNVIAQDAQLQPVNWPARLTVKGLATPRETPLAGGFLGFALILLLADILAALALGGKLRGARAGIVLLALLALPDATTAQDATADEAARLATSELVLGHILTGNAEVDRLAQAGMLGLSETLYFRTSVEPADPVGVDLEQDELAFYPFLYWPITADMPLPSPEAYGKLNTYLRSGGMILFDTRDADIAGFGNSTATGRKLQELARPLDIPPLEPVPEDHVLTRTFYLLQDFPGRYTGRGIWVEAAQNNTEQIDGMPFRNLNDNVTPVVIGGNDWAAAWAMDQRGTPLVRLGRGYGGERQREIAYRFGVNLVMHVLTGNYKSDQVHVPALLDRLGQ